MRLFYTKIMNEETPSLFDQESGPSIWDMDWEPLTQEMLSCTRCRLCEQRTNVVVGEGDVNTTVMFIGEGPGEQEDVTGRPFVGRAGQLLDKILEAAHIPRESVYITNMVKCRPPGNRNPQKDETDECWPFVSRQIALIKPKVIVSLGNVPTQFFLKTTTGITKTRGQFYPWKDGIEIFPMYHPSYLLRNPSKNPGSPKHQAWQDIQTLKTRMDEFAAEAG